MIRPVLGLSCLLFSLVENLKMGSWGGGWGGCSQSSRDNIPPDIYSLIGLFRSGITDSVLHMFPRRFCHVVDLIGRIRLFKEGEEVRHLNPLR